LPPEPPEDIWANVKGGKRPGLLLKPAQFGQERQVVRGLRAPGAVLGQGHEGEVAGVGDPVQWEEGPSRWIGGSGRQDDKRRRDPAETDAMGMFVEIAEDHGGSGRMAAERGLDRVKLAAAGGTQQAEMDGHDPQRGGSVEVDDHRPARLMPRQVQPVEAGKMDAGSGEQRVAMPAETDGIAPDGQGFKAGQGGNPVTRQGRRSVAEAEVGLLQRHNIGPEGGDPRKYPVGIAAHVGAKRLPDVPGRDTQGGL
jgi:hypothetical protein